MTAVLLNSLLPIFAVVGLGYFAGFVRDIDNRHVAGVESHEAGSTLIVSTILSTGTLAAAQIITAPS
jgi:malonate transporter